MRWMALGLALGMLACRTAPAHPENVEPQDAVAFVDVNVVPMDSERLLAHQTAVVSGARILAQGPEQVRQRVREYKAAGYDGLKTHGYLTRETYDVRVAEARGQAAPGEEGHGHRRGTGPMMG